MRRGFTWGFTLIELLVVVAIIAILAAILFPVFGRAKAKAKAMSCLSNIKEITLGCLMYADDYDECTGVDDHGPRGANYTWVSQVYPYLRNDEIFGCPSNTYKYRQDTRGAWNTRYYGSYAVNMSRHGTTTDGLTGSGEIYCYRPLGTIQYPAQCLMIGEVEGANNGPAGMWRTWAGLTPDACFLHNEGTNVGFFDGHAKWVNENTMRQQPNTPFWTGGA
jgi:prepilin-type N-terminal cleavage/methylation domain-containing protein/prepilin-type processing-associated H-X9-DG protein